MRRQDTPASASCRDRIAGRRGRNIGVVAAARELLEFVYYALRDGQVRCARTRRPRHEPAPRQLAGRGSCLV